MRGRERMRVQQLHIVIWRAQLVPRMAQHVRQCIPDRRSKSIRYLDVDHLAQQIDLLCPGRRIGKGVATKANSR